MSLVGAFVESRAVHRGRRDLPSTCRWPAPAP